MEKELFEKLFIKLNNESKNIKKSTNGSAEYFTGKIIPQERFKKYGDVVKVTSRTIVNYYNKYVENNAGNTGSPTSELISLIKDYLDEKELPSNPPCKNIIECLKKYLLQIIASLFILFFSVFIYQNNNTVNNNCIIWKIDHYQKSSCLNQKSINNNKYLINIITFKKILPKKGETDFFKNGKAIVWYGKNLKGIREYFSSRGIHPETKKELKPITRYILNEDNLLP